MIISDFATFVRYITRTNTTTLTDAELKLLAGIAMDDIAGKILDANEDYFGVPQHTDLIANQREYPFPDDVLSQIKRLEVAFDPATPLKYIKLDEIDLTSYKHGTDEATVVQYFTNYEGSAAYDIYRKALRLFSGTIASVSNGIRLWTYQWPSHITDLTSGVDLSVDPDSTHAGFPRQFHELLATKVSMMYKASTEKPIPLTENELSYKVTLQEKLDSIKKLNLDREIKATVPYNDGSQY